MKTGSVNKVMLSYTEALGKRGKKKSVNTDPFIFNFEFFKKITLKCSLS